MPIMGRYRGIVVHVYMKTQVLNYEYIESEPFLNCFNITRKRFTVFTYILAVVEILASGLWHRSMRGSV